MRPEDHVRVSEDSSELPRSLTHQERNLVSETGEGNPKNEIVLNAQNYILNPAIVVYHGFGSVPSTFSLKVLSYRLKRRISVECYECEM